MSDVNRKMAKGAAWMLLFKLFERSLSIISIAILARLLLPEDFGLIVMATVVISFVELLRAFNFDSALIQNQKANDQHYNTAWTLNVLSSIIIGVMNRLIQHVLSLWVLN